MAYSMTGYGNSQGKFNGLEITVEIRTVNNRFQEIAIKLPKNYQIYEYFIREYLKDKILRGKVSVFVQITATDNEESGLKLNKTLLKNYLEIVSDIKDLTGSDASPTLSDYLQLPDIINENDDLSLDEDLKKNLKASIDEAVTHLNDMRKQEGDALLDDIRCRKNWLKEAVAFIEKESENSSREEFEKFKNRVSTLLNDIKLDKDRLEQEIAILSDKVDVSEETVRLNSHINLLEKELEKDGTIGKKLNFILQEMNREVNTIGSKTSKTSISHKVVECKEEIEKIREQVQNIE